MPRVRWTPVAGPSRRTLRELLALAMYSLRPPCPATARQLGEISVGLDDLGIGMREVGVVDRRVGRHDLVEWRPGPYSGGGP